MSAGPVDAGRAPTGHPAFARRLATIQRRIAKLRDQLRSEQRALGDLISSATEVESGVSDALENLDYAIDRLSEQQ